MFFTKVVHEFWQLFRYEVLKLQKTSVSEVPFMFSSTRLISRRFSVQHYNPWVHVHDCTFYNKMMPGFWHFDIAIDREYCFNLFARYTSKWKYIDFFPVKALRLFQILFTNFQPSQSFRWMKADLKKKNHSATLAFCHLLHMRLYSSEKTLQCLKPLSFFSHAKALFYLSHDTRKPVFGSFRPCQTQTGLHSHKPACAATEAS